MSNCNITKKKGIQEIVAKSGKDPCAFSIPNTPDGKQSSCDMVFPMGCKTHERVCTNKPVLTVSPAVISGKCTEPSKDSCGCPT